MFQGFFLDDGAKKSFNASFSCQQGSDGMNQTSLKNVSLIHVHSSDLDVQFFILMFSFFKAFLILANDVLKATSFCSLCASVCKNFPVLEGPESQLD